MKEDELERNIRAKLSDYPVALVVFDKLCKDEEVTRLIDLANHISVNKLGFNDHGRVHVKITLLNALSFFELLNKSTIVGDDFGGLDDAYTSIVLGAFLHDIGMSINRKDHELLGVILARPIMKRLLEGHNNKEVIISVACQGILGHMGVYKPDFVEAGCIIIGDGSDMTKGRARIPYMLETYKKNEKIHTFSALSITEVNIKKGKDKPILMEVVMDNPAGVFQVEEVFLPKLKNSGFMDKVSVVAVINKERIVIV
jgi:metal-dependent HD superfamily phosphatase/phosphodiesterase